MKTNCSQNVGFHFPMGRRRCSPADARLKMHGSPPNSCTQMGRRRWPPPGGVQSAGHRRCANGVPNGVNNRFQIHPHSSQSANLENQALYARQRSYTPLFVSPQEPGDHRSPPQNFCFLCLVGAIWAIFSPSETRLKTDIEKTPKKMQKTWILASQNIPKTRSKSSQNRSPEKHAIFYRFLSNFCYLLQALTSKFRRPSQCFVAFHTFRFFDFRLQFYSKKPTKNPSKTTSEPFKNRCQKCIYCFLTLIFSGFGLDFGWSWGLQLGAKLTILASKT